MSIFYFFVFHTFCCNNNHNKELDHPANVWVEKVQKLIKDKFEDKPE